jgi:hypothetical protein
MCTVGLGQSPSRHDSGGGLIAVDGKKRYLVGIASRVSGENPSIPIYVTYAKVFGPLLYSRMAGGS